MKPGKILLFLLSIFVLLAGMISVFPKEGIKINSDITLYFTNFDDLFSLKKVHYADISKISDPLDSTNQILNIDDLVSKIYSMRNIIFLKLKISLLFFVACFTAGIIVNAQSNNAKPLKVSNQTFDLLQEVKIKETEKIKIDKTIAL